MWNSLGLLSGVNPLLVAITTARFTIPLLPSWCCSYPRRYVAPFPEHDSGNWKMNWIRSDHTVILDHHSRWSLCFERKCQKTGTNIITFSWQFGHIMINHISTTNLWHCCNEVEVKWILIFHAFLKIYVVFFYHKNMILLWICNHIFAT